MSQRLGAGQQSHQRGGLDSPNRINWFAGHQQHQRPGRPDPGLQRKPDRSIALQINGSAALDVFGAVVGTATFSITQGTQTARHEEHGDWRTGGVLNNASVMSISLSNLNLFAGIVAACSYQRIRSNLASRRHCNHRRPGLRITGGSVTMAIVRPAGLAVGDKTSYLGLEVSLAGAALSASTG
jgi:hypothetical protein